MNTKTDISAAYVGSTGVDKLCLGNEVVWQNTPPAPVPYDEQYLTFKITSPGTIRFGKVAPQVQNVDYAPTVTIYYKVNSGDWTAITSSSVGTEFSVVSGDTVQFKGDNPLYGHASATGGNKISANSFSGSTAGFNIQGNIMSLIDSEDFAIIERDWDYTRHNSAFYRLFQGTHVVDASNLILQPSGATRVLLAESIYSFSFYNCTGLTAVPELPETDSLPYNCYGYMFSTCTSLTTAPELKATIMGQSCYTGMFYGCTGLTQAPALPATTLSGNCYTAMFSKCTSLTQAPALPATTLAGGCYSNMFAGCTSLTTSPVLPATTLVGTQTSGCYQGMFSGCTSLSVITCLATSGITTAYTKNWTTNVAATGTFYKDPSATGWSTGVNGIPRGWTVQNYVDPNAPVLKIAGQSITGTSVSGRYEWGGLTQYSGTSFTIEVLGVPITADTWDYSENYIDECGEGSEISHDSGATRSTFEVSSGYIDAASYDPNNNSVEYSSLDDQTSDDPETICRCQGGCWDGETCQECPQSCEDQGLCDDGEGNCVECPDPCDDWEGAGYGSYEECRCAEVGENCPEEESGE